MGDKRNTTVPKTNNKGAESPGKYFRAVEAWVEDVEKIDDQFHDIPLYGHIQTNLNNKDSDSVNQKVEEKGPASGHKDRAIDEANDNINVNEMLLNIMEALKEDDKGPKKPTKKKEYVPLERVKRQDPDLDKPVFNNVKQENVINLNKNKDIHDIHIEEYDKTYANGFGGNRSRKADPTLLLSDGFNSMPNQNLNPFAQAIYPTEQVNEALTSQKDAIISEHQNKKSNIDVINNFKNFESKESTINDLSAIMDDAQQRDMLDSRGSFVPGIHLFGPNGRRGLNKGSNMGTEIINPLGKGEFNNDDLDFVISKRQNTPGVSGNDGKNDEKANTNLEKGIVSQPRKTTHLRDVKGEYNWVPVAGAIGESVDNANHPKANRHEKSSNGTLIDGENSRDEDRQNNQRKSIRLCEQEQEEKPINLTNGERKSRKSQVLDLISRLTGDKKTGSVDKHNGKDKLVEDIVTNNSVKSKSRGKSTEKAKGSRKGNEPSSPGILITTKLSTNHGTQENYDEDFLRPNSRTKGRANLGTLNSPIKIDTLENLKNTTTSPGHKQHDKGILRTDKSEHTRAGSEEQKLNGAHHRNKQSNLGLLADDTQDTNIQRDLRKHSEDLTNIFGNDKLAPLALFNKNQRKDENLHNLMKNRLHDQSDGRSWPLSKKITGESDLMLDEESPFFVNFKKRKYDEEESILLSHNESQVNDSFENQQSAKSESKLEWEELDAPISGSMIKLFVGFKNRVSRIEYLVDEVRKPDYTMDTFFERNFRCFKGKLQVTKNFFFLFVILTAVMLFFIFDTLQAADLSRVKNDSEKKYVAELLIPAAIIFTYYGIAFLYIPYKWLRFVVLAQLLPSLIILGIDLGNTFVADKSFTYGRVYVCSYIIFTNVFWGATRYLRKDILKNYSWAWSMLFMTAWCILLPTATIAYAIYVTIVSRRFDYNWAHDLIIQIGVPTLLLLCLTWVYYHFKFFVPAAKKKGDKVASELKKPKQQTETQTREAEDRIKEQFAEVSEDEEEEKEEKPKQPLKVRIYVTVRLFLKKINNVLIIASSLSLGGSLIFIEGLLLVYLATITEDKKIPTEAPFYFALLLFFFIPTAVLFGIPIIATNKNHSNKMFWVPVVAILFPLFITMPVASALLNDGASTNPVGIFFALAPTVVIAFWLTVSYIGLKRKKTKFGLISYVFIFFVIPLVVLQPLIDINGFKAVQVARGFFIFLLSIGILILIVAIAYLISRGLLIKEISKKDRLNTDNYKLINIFRVDLQPFGYWSNSLGFIINFTITLFTLFHAPSIASTELRGMALGLAFCFIILFVYNNLALKLNIIETTEVSVYGVRSLSAAIIESVRNNELFEETQKIRDYNNRIKGYTRLFSLFSIILSIILALALSRSSRFVLGIFATIAIGTVVIQVLFEIYGGIKTKYTTIARATISLLITYFWFVHALAFPSILHFTRVFYSDNEARRRRIQTQLIVLVFVLTVSLIAIIANIIFKGIELQQKIKYILAYLRKQLENIAVKSDYFVLQKIFDGYMETGENRLRKTLLNRGKPAFWWPMPDTNPNTKYSKVLLDFDAYKYMKLKLKNKLDNENQDENGDNKKKAVKKSWFSKCLGCLNLCFPFMSSKKKEFVLDEDLKEEIDDLLDLQMGDIPLPPQDEDEESDESDDDYEPINLGDWEIESKIADNLLEITDIKFKPLDERVLRAMMYYDSGIKFAHNDKFLVDFLKFVYRLFAVGQYRYFKKRWLDYIGYKRFMILSALFLEKEFPDYMIDLAYTQYTHTVGKGQIQRRVDYSTKKNQAKKKPKKNKKEVERDQKLRVKVFPIFEEDFEGFLIHLARRRFPNEVNDKDALYRLIRWHLFPNFLHLLPSVQKEYPHEYDYLLFLIDLYMKQDKEKQGTGNNENDKIPGDGTDQNGDIDADNVDGNGKNKNLGEGIDGFDGANGSKNTDGNRNSHLNNSRDALNKGRKLNCCKRLTNALCNTLSIIGGAIAKCAGYFLSNIGDFLLSFFFLKTNAQKKADKEFEIMERKADKEEREAVKKSRADKAAETKLGDDAELLEEELNKQGQFRRKRKVYPHKPSPEWPQIVETIMKSLKDAENDYENKKASQKQPYFVPSVRNICTLLAKIFEVYSLASLAFRAEVPWEWSSTLQTVFAFPSGSIDAYKFKIWSSLAYSIFYCYIGMVSINFAKEGLLGADKATMKAGEFPSRGFAHSQILTHFSTTFSVWIIFTFLNLFSCDYYSSPNHLFFMQPIICGSYNGIWFIVLAAFGLFFYYPISSFLYPNLQYLNVGNDIKYDPSFVVLFNQAKLIIIAVTVFFPYKDEVVIPLLVSIAIWIGIAITNNILKPNAVIVLNLWETSMYFMGAWIQISALIVYFSKNTALASTLLPLGLIAIFLVTYAIHRYNKLPFSFEKTPKSDEKNAAKNNDSEELDLNVKNDLQTDLHAKYAKKIENELPDLQDQQLNSNE